MKEHRWSSPLVRGVAVLAVLLIAAGAISPAFGAQGLTKTKARKIAKKQATNQINALVPGLINGQVPGLIDANTIDQGTIPAVTMSQTDADKTVYTKGPFTVSMDCSDDAGSVNLVLNVRTSEANSLANDNYGTIQGDLDPGDGNQVFVDFTGNAPGGDAVSYYSPYYGAIFLKSPSGTNVFLQFDQTTNYMGHHCYVDGWFLDLA